MVVNGMMIFGLICCVMFGCVMVLGFVLDNWLVIVGLSYCIVIGWCVGIVVDVVVGYLFLNIVEYF